MRMCIVVACLVLIASGRAAGRDTDWFRGSINDVPMDKAVERPVGHAGTLSAWLHSGDCDRPQLIEGKDSWTNPVKGLYCTANLKLWQRAVELLLDGDNRQCRVKIESLTWRLAPGPPLGMDRLNCDLIAERETRAAVSDRLRVECPYALVSGEPGDNKRDNLHGKYLVGRDRTDWARIPILFWGRVTVVGSNAQPATNAGNALCLARERDTPVDKRRAAERALNLDWALEGGSIHFVGTTGYDGTLDKRLSGGDQERHRGDRERRRGVETVKSIYDRLKNTFDTVVGDTCLE